MAHVANASARVLKQKASVRTRASGRTTAKTTPTDLQLDLAPLSGVHDCRYSVELHTEDSYDHDSDGDDYCRCRRIDSATVIDVDHLGIARHFFKKKPNPFVFYALERILRAYLRPNTFDDFKVSWGRSYYGDETDEVIMPVPAGLREAVLRMMEPMRTRGVPESEIAIQVADRCVRAALTAEYGHVLPQLEGKLWTIEAVARKKIVVPGTYQALERTVVAGYRSRFACKTDIPNGIAVANAAGGFDLIDGRHRYAAAEDQKNIRLIVGR